MQEKVYILIAGVNGAGKSTFYSIHDQICPLFPFCDNNSFHNLSQLNPDKIIRSLGDWRDFNTSRDGMKIAIKIIRDNFEQGVSFSQETTLTGHSILRNFETAKKKGYKVGIVYVGVDSVDIAKQRVQHRVKNGGHGIPEKDIERRYINSFKNLNLLMTKCDGVLLYDNSTENGFRIIAEYDGNELLLRSDPKQVPAWVKKHIEIPLINQTEKQISLNYDNEIDLKR